jgi:hypothetical protein
MLVEQQVAVPAASVAAEILVVQVLQQVVLITASAVADILK